MPKTPKFDAALDAILADLKPHTRVCTETGESFNISPKDIEMFKLLRVPPPTTVWWAAIRKQRAFLAGYDLFRRPAMNGADVVTYYDPDSPARILSKNEWQGDQFNPLEYGASVDPQLPFFEQWMNFSYRVPRPSIIQYGRNENSEWCSYAFDYKDCYGSYAGLDVEDAVYSDSNGWCKHVLEILSSGWCEFSYDSACCMRSSRLLFCERCEDSMNLSFCLGCRNCSDCFGCSNLKNKKFCFLNEQLTEEEYKKRIAEIDLSDSRVVEEWREKSEKIFDNAFRRAAYVIRSEAAVGDDIEDCRDVSGVTVRKSERAYDCFGIGQLGRDVMRFSYGGEVERCYESTDVGHSSDCHFCVSTDKCINVEYSELLTNCENCFGCIGLKHKKFCVFNVQYAEEEYWSLVDEIKTAMLARGEYGEFFPYRASPFAYDLSHSGMMFPLLKTEVEHLGARWYEPVVSADVEDAAVVPERLADVTDDIVKLRFRCPETGRAYFFIPREIALHREMNVALPRVHSIVNRIRRTQIYLPPRLYERVCASCGIQVHSKLSAEKSANVLCGSCYEQVTLGEKPAPVSAA